MVAYILACAGWVYSVLYLLFLDGGDTAMVMMWIAWAAILVLGEIQVLKRKM